MPRSLSHDVRRLILELGLHDDGPPVSLTPLYDLFIPEEVDLRTTGIPACVVLPPDRDITPTTPATIYLDRRLDRCAKRQSYAHEVGHALLGHTGSVPHLDMGDWWHDSDEREAWEVAALLLIPHEAFQWGWTGQEVAAACEVEPWLVELYPHGKR